MTTTLDRPAKTSTDVLPNGEASTEGLSLRTAEASIARTLAMIDTGRNPRRRKRAADGIMAVMGREGDTKTIWDKNNADEVENARDTFQRMLAKGFAAFRTKGKGEKDVQIREFDPDAQSIIFVPQIAGG